VDGFRDPKLVKEKHGEELNMTKCYTLDACCNGDAWWGNLSPRTVPPVLQSKDLVVWPPLAPGRTTTTLVH